MRRSIREIKQPIYDASTLILSLQVTRGCSSEMSNTVTGLLLPYQNWENPVYRSRESQLSYPNGKIQKPASGSIRESASMLDLPQFHATGVDSITIRSSHGCHGCFSCHSHLWYTFFADNLVVLSLADATSLKSTRIWEAFILLQI